VERGVRKAWTSLAAGLLMAGLTACDRGSHPGNIGKPAAQFVMTDGVENLWATWCAPCVQELPSLLALKQKMPDIAVVAVSTDQDDEVYRAFLVKHHVDIPTVRDSDQKINALYGTVQIPETYIIDRNGVLRRKFIGAQDWTGPEITDYLKKL
jgi:cytochrome c biogenesis protein CcmG/thiol:disulfide interchange protein DsbE